MDRFYTTRVCPGNDTVSRSLFTNSSFLMTSVNRASASDTRASNSRSCTGALKHSDHGTIAKVLKEREAWTQFHRRVGVVVRGFFDRRRFKIQNDSGVLGVGTKAATRRGQRGYNAVVAVFIATPNVITILAIKCTKGRLAALGLIPFLFMFAVDAAFTQNAVRFQAQCDFIEGWSNRPQSSGPCAQAAP